MADTLFPDATIRWGELHLSKPGEVLWHTLGDIHGRLMGVCDLHGRA
jgi:hypothetical protein